MWRVQGESANAIKIGSIKTPRQRQWPRPTLIGCVNQRRPAAQAIDARTLDDPYVVNREKHDLRYIYARLSRAHATWVAFHHERPNKSAETLCLLIV